MNDYLNTTVQEENLSSAMDDLLQPNLEVAEGDVRAHKRLRYRLTAFGNFNKYTLFPLLKRIREDDTAAVVAFLALIALVVLAVFLLSVLL